MCALLGTLHGKCVYPSCVRITGGKCRKLLARFVRISSGNIISVAGNYTITNLKNGPICHAKSCGCCVARGVHSGSTGTMNPFVVTDLR